MNDEKYIEHEVKLRVHDALFNHIDYKFAQVDAKFDSLEKRIDRMDTKFNWAIGLIVSGVLIPIILKHFGI